MLRLLYLSQSIKTITEQQILDILQSSQRNNSANEITGVLIHGGGLFMQILEGAENKVLPLYIRILEDRRHSNSRLIHISPASERMFNKWSMGTVKRSPLEFQEIAQLLSHRTESVTEKEFKKFMLEFRAKLNSEQAQNPVA